MAGSYLLTVVSHGRERREREKERGSGHSLVFPRVCVSVSVCAQSLSRVQLFFDPMGCSLPGSSVLGILQARTLEWIAMPSSRGSSQPRYQTCISSIAGEFFADESSGKPRERQCATLIKQHSWRQGEPMTSFSPASPCGHS